MPIDAMARRKLFATRSFRREAAQRLNLDFGMVEGAINALLAAGIVPCTNSDNTEGLAIDGAWLLMAIGSRVRPDAIARVTPRFAEMTLQVDSDSPSVASLAAVPPHGGTFEAELVAMFRNSWNAARNPALTPVDALGVSLQWSDGRGSVLFGTIDRWEKGRPRHRKVFASHSLQLPPAPGGDWDFVHLLDSFRLPAVGGIAFSPPPLCGFIELLAKAVDNKAESLIKTERAKEK
jgi:hypothetical protein